MNRAQVEDRLLTWRFELRRTLGLPGLFGAVLLGAAMLIAVAIPRVDADVDSHELRDSERLARTPSARHADAERAAVVDAVSLHALPDLFPGFAQSADDIATILAQARDSNLTLGSAEYLVTNDSSARFVRYQMVLPVKDQYGVIRRFLASVLNSVPNAALREIHVERPAVDGNVLDARVRFELIYRAAQP
ncbi:putative transmembrane protein [Burkholderia sp. H160]|nr:putative transmembrane protein [Burkholderia sp. H160]